MAKRWHHADQKKTEAPLSSNELRELASSGRLKPDDLIRAEGMNRWHPAVKVAGLFPRTHGKWYYTHCGKRFGPVSGTMLRRLAKVGMLQPTDLVWREGLDDWKKARRLVGLFLPGRASYEVKTVPDPLTQPEKPLVTKRDKHSRRHRSGSRRINRIDSVEAPASHKMSTPTREQSQRRKRSQVFLVVGLGIFLVATIVRGMVLEPWMHAGATGTLPIARVPVQGPEDIGCIYIPAPPRPDEPAGPIEVNAKGDEEHVDADIHPASGADKVFDERALGRLVHERVLKDHRVLVSSPLLGRVEKVAATLLDRRERTDIEYHYFVLDSDSVSAFSHLGGYIYVSRGLFSLVANDIELAWVLGHEIAHVDLKHCLATPTTATKLPGLDPAQSYHSRIAVGHSTEDEYASDAWAMRRLQELGYNGYECLTFLNRYRRHLESKLRSLDASSTSPPSALATGSQTIDRHWLTMPSPETRLKQLEKLRH